MNHSSITLTIQQPSARPGTVYLVGAGPGHPDLLTVRARGLLQTCDVLVYDHLTDERARSLVCDQCERINVGKEAGKHSVQQEEVNRILLEKASAGNSVVRLKGGDPFVFGRGGEEMEILHANAIPYEIIPGVTAAIAAASLIGIPLTHRKINSGVYFITGHEDPDRAVERLDWEALSRSGETLCIYMPLTRLSMLVEKLLEKGLPPDLPSVMVQSVSLPEQKTVSAPLRSIVHAVAENEIVSPAILFLGQSAEYASGYGWFEKLPLHGKRIVLTRQSSQAGKWRTVLEGLGAEVLVLPAIEVQLIDAQDTAEEIFPQLGHYDWIVLSSRHGVDGFFRHFFKFYKDIRSLGACRFAVVGKGTRSALRNFNIEPDLVPEKATGKALAKALIETGSLPSAQVLWVTGNLNDPDFISNLEQEGGAIVDRLPVYETLEISPDTAADAERFRQKGADAIVFASASAVSGFAKKAKRLQPAQSAHFPLAVSIGPVTSEALKKAGIPISGEADEASLEGVANKLIEVLNSQP